MQIEFRHKDWYEEEVFTDLMKALADRGLGAVITDVALQREALHQCLTCPTAFIRFNGYALHPTDFARLDAWAERLETWIARGMEKVYFFMHQEDESHTIVLCDYFIRKVNERLGMNLKPLHLRH